MGEETIKKRCRSDWGRVGDTEVTSEGEAERRRGGEGEREREEEEAGKGKVARARGENNGQFEQVALPSRYFCVKFAR